MYKKVLYNIKKMKKCVGGGGGAIFEPKTLSMYLKKEKKSKKKVAKLRLQISKFSKGNNSSPFL